MDMDIEKLRQEHNKYCEKFPICKCTYCGHEVSEIYVKTRMDNKCTICFKGFLKKIRKGE